MPARRVRINGRDVIDPRHTRAWRKLRDDVVDDEPVCRLQFPGICTGASQTADHIKTVKAHPELAMVRSNLRGACHACNDARHNVPDEAINHDRTDPPALGVFG